jgi:hypothetical protein
MVAAVNEFLFGQKQDRAAAPFAPQPFARADDFAAQEESVRELIAAVRLHFRRKLLDRPAGISAARF